MKIIEFTNNYEHPVINKHTHNFIFTSKSFENESSLGHRFVEGDFLCSSQKHKMIYAFIFLRHSWFIFDGTNLGGSIPKKEARQFLTGHFIQWVYNNFSVFDESLRKTFIALNENDAFPSLKHHDTFLSFPSYRNVEKGLNVEFIEGWLNEFVLNNYSVLGGNKKRSFSMEQLDVSYEKAKFISVTSDMQLSNPYDIVCEKDNKTGEFVIYFRYRNALTKIGFPK